MPETLSSREAGSAILQTQTRLPGQAACMAAARSMIRLHLLALTLAVVTLVMVACRSGGSDSGSGTQVSDGAGSALAQIDRGLELQAQDSLVQAEDCYRKSIEFARQAADSSALARGLVALARLNIMLELYHRAEPDVREALRYLRKEQSAPPDSLALVWLNLAECGEGLKKYATADSASDSALALCTTGSESTGPLRARMLRTRGRLLIRMNREAESEPLLRSAVSLCEQWPDPDRTACAEPRGLLGWCLARMGRFAEAEPWLLSAYAPLIESSNRDDEQVRITAGYLAELYDRWRKPDLFAHYQAVASPPPPEEDAGP